MMSFGEFATFLKTVETRVRPALLKTMTKVGKAQVKIAKGYIGQELPEWAPLADSTIDEKANLGYGGQVSATDPLLREGQLRESIKFRPPVATAAGIVLDVGSDDKIALYQEMGTTKIPPRPFISLSAVENMFFAQMALGKTAVAIFTEKPE